jgi:hypothetical protein
MAFINAVPKKALLKNFFIAVCDSTENFLALNSKKNGDFEAKTINFLTFLA